MRDPTLVDLLDGAPGAPSLREGGREITRGELAALAGGVARRLLAEGLSPGEALELEVRTDVASVAALLGARAAGLAVSPVAPGLPGAGGRRWRPSELVGELAPLAPLESEGAALVVPTSGSSGPPKRVLLSGRAIRAATGAIQQGLRYSAGAEVLCALPLHHTYGLSQLWLAARSGAILRLYPGPALPGELLKAAANASIFPAVPALLRALLRAGAPGQLRQITLAGQPVPEAWRRAFAEALPGAAFHLLYGMTEACTRILALPPEDFLARPLATGLPIPGVAARLADDGELVVEAPHLADGYQGDPEATAARFAGGALRTGDLFRQEGPYLCFLGRSDGAFKRFGEKVIPEQVEAALLQHPGVERCVAERAVDPDGEPTLRLRYVPSGAPLPRSELLRHCRQLLPGAAVPTEFEATSELPTTPTGKIRRSAWTSTETPQRS